MIPQNPDDTLTWLTTQVSDDLHQGLAAIDLALAKFLHARAPETQSLPKIAAALVSYQLRRGHVCLDLQRLHREAPAALQAELANISIDQWLSALQASPWVDCVDPGSPPITEPRAGRCNDEGDDQGANQLDDPETRPLVLLISADSNHNPAERAYLPSNPDGHPRLYLRRYWRDEVTVRTWLTTQLAVNPNANNDQHNATQAAHHPRLPAVLEILFPPERQSGDDSQAIACALALRSRFAIITGGPGTGKTTTVVKLLAAMQTLALSQTQSQSQAPLSDPDATPISTPRTLRIQLAAPTGKAAARLNGAITQAVDHLPLAELLAITGTPSSSEPNSASEPTATLNIPTQVTTLHRLLGAQAHTRRFRHHADQPLPLDVLVIDEASMVDLEMMAAVLQALPQQARLILLGDKDQLASVEAGAVLGELCQRAQQGHYWPETYAYLQQVLPKPKTTPINTATQPDAHARSSEHLLDWPQRGRIDPNGTALDQAIVMLRHSHRFAADSGIGRLADLANRGERRTFLAELAHLSQQPASGVRWLHLELDAAQRLTSESASAFAQLITTGTWRPFKTPTSTRTQNSNPVDGYSHYLHQLFHDLNTHQTASAPTWASKVLAAYTRFQVLSPLREGPWGVDGLNRQIATWLRQAKSLRTLTPDPIHAPSSSQTTWYAGRPVRVTRNDYNLGLMNGDIGITLPMPSRHLTTDANPQSSRLSVAFPGATATDPVRWVLPSRLQSVETVYAMTVHQSQGSEFDHTVVLIPPTPSPILTRELIYTAMTRAKSQLTLVTIGAADRLGEGLGRRVERASGLMRW